MHNNDLLNLQAHLNTIEKEATGKRKHARNLIENAIELTLIYEGHPYQTPERTGARILITYGGPTIELTIEDGNDWTTLTGNWGGTTETRELYTPKLIEELNNLTY